MRNLGSYIDPSPRIELHGALKTLIPSFTPVLGGLGAGCRPSFGS